MMGLDELGMDASQPEVLSYDATKHFFINDVGHESVDPKA